MASVLHLGDFERLLPHFGLASHVPHEPGLSPDSVFWPATCEACGGLFQIELIVDEGEILFNYEDLLCPCGCNSPAVISADFNEQMQYERLEFFFDPQCQTVLVGQLSPYFRLLFARLDN